MTDDNGWIGFIMGAILAGALVGIMTHTITKSNYQTEAVVEGHAAWIVNDNGTTDFQWNKACKVEAEMEYQ